MNDNSLLIDDYTLSVLHFDDPNEPIKDECGKLKWKSKFNLVNNIKPNGKFENCIDLSDKLIFIIPPPPEISSKSYTIDFWVYKKDDYGILFSRGDNGKDFAIGVSSSYLYIKKGNISHSTVGGIKLNNWHHVAFVVDENFDYLFLDGKIYIKVKI